MNIRKWLTETYAVLPNWVWLAIALAVVILIVLVIVLCCFSKKKRARRKERAEVSEPATEEIPSKQEEAPVKEEATPVKAEAVQESKNDESARLGEGSAEDKEIDMAQKKEEKPAAKPAQATKPAQAAKPAQATKPAQAAKPAQASAKSADTAKKDVPAAKPAQTAKPAPASKPDQTAAKSNQTAAADKSDKQPSTKTYHISLRKGDGKWQVKIGGGEKAIKLFDTQAQAIDYAKSLADNQDANIVIHKKDGSFRKLTY